ncbi:MAG: hypothetical protein V7K15_16160 [Nostoc sp.]
MEFAKSTYQPELHIDDKDQIRYLQMQKSFTLSIDEFYFYFWY